MTKQQVFVLKHYLETDNEKILHSLLDSGWKVISMCPLGGTSCGEGDKFFVGVVIVLEKEEDLDD